MYVITCVSCGAVITADDVNSLPPCSCGQQMVCNPNGYGGKPYVDGIYRNCLECGELITGTVSYTQHLHDECYLKQQRQNDCVPDLIVNEV